MLFDVADETVDDVGPVEPDKSEIREDPYSLPDKFKWDSLNLDDDKQVSWHGYQGRQMPIHMRSHTTLHFNYISCPTFIRYSASSSMSFLGIGSKAPLFLYFLFM